MARKQRVLGNDTYFTVFNSDLKLIKDPVKKILFGKIKNWIYRNEDKESKIHLKNGYYWSFASYKYWADECGLEEKTVGKHLRELVKSGILIVGNFNIYKQDKTFWYRLPTEEELNNVNFRMLYYGKSISKKGEQHSNEYLLECYKNGMIDVTKRDKLKEKLGSPLPEDKSEYSSEDNSEYIKEHNSNHNTEIITDYIKEDIKKNNSNDYNELMDENNILIHFDFFSKIKLEETSTDLIKLFINRFHESCIDSIINQEDLFKYKCRFDVLNNHLLGQKNISYCFNLINRYFNLVISPQNAEQNGDELTPNITISNTNPFQANIIQNIG
ncbi:helix-turn-helix domain-containing protein [Aquirufa rosea]|uniref:Uncharacterized protein n=1 Tax=Aquirufa rosea TaxID=2509241 RepID=A0A4Q1BWZ2_9BACT|nr:hypothetical protein [Aquirufa rosea]RXK46505.1 hypothetical protein ESB04_12285 [Aquirufa rosea]